MAMPALLYLLQLSKGGGGNTFRPKQRLYKTAFS